MIGDGDDLTSFISKESSILGTTTSASISTGLGGLGSFIAAKAVQSSTGVDEIVPKTNYLGGKLIVEKAKIRVVDKDDSNDVKLIFVKGNKYRFLKGNC